MIRMYLFITAPQSVICGVGSEVFAKAAVSYTHLRAHETLMNLVCRLLLEKKNIFLFFFFFNDTATHKIYTILFVGSVRCV